jgi:hypothetical protein
MAWSRFALGEPAPGIVAGATARRQATEAQRLLVRRGADRALQPAQDGSQPPLTITTGGDRRLNPDGLGNVLKPATGGA